MAEERKIPQQQSLKAPFIGDVNLPVHHANIVNIHEGVFISRSAPKASGQVIQSFSTQLSPTEEGYVATSHLCNIYELEKTRTEAVRSYLYSLTDELIWLQKHEKTLSKPLLEELNRIKTYIRIV